MQRVYKNKQYVIYKTADGYVVVNVLMDGFAHTHLESFDMCKRIVFLSLHKRCPRNLSDYLLISLLRINTDEEFCRKINELINNRRKKQKYFNSNRGVRRE